MYLPWVLLGWTLLLGGLPVPEFIGIMVGHLYYFLEHLYPATSGIHFLKTPAFMQAPFSSLHLPLPFFEPDLFFFSSQPPVLSR